MNHYDKTIFKVYGQSEMRFVYLIIWLLITLSLGGGIAKMLVGENAVFISIGVGILLSYAIYAVVGLDMCMLIIYMIMVGAEIGSKCAKPLSTFLFDRQGNREYLQTIRHVALRARMQEAYNTDPKRFIRDARLLWGFTAFTSVGLLAFLIDVFSNSMMQEPINRPILLILPSVAAILGAWGGPDARKREYHIK